MKPEEMTNEQLVESVSRKHWVSIGTYYSYQGTRGLCLEEKELLRRLNESDALRKENEELRKFLDTDAAGRPLYVLLHDAWSVADNGPLADCLHEISVALEAIDYDALNARIESANQKEASHE